MTFTHTPNIEHDLHPHFPQLLDFHSIKSLENSELYRELKTKILRVLHSYELENNSPAPVPKPSYRAVAWNVERGICFEAILHFLKNHPVLSQADVILMTETDLGMARSGNRNVAREIAQALKMNYFFAPSYLNLAKGSGVEHEFKGENEFGIHGNAILSRYPILKPRIINLPNAHDKMKGREKRLGNQRALVASIDLGGKYLRAGCAHLDVRSTQAHRKFQLEQVVNAIQEEGNQVALIGGDWNTSTYDSHSALSSIIGFWVRVLMGTGNMILNHYPHPDRLFEKDLFQMLEKNGFDYRGCNQEDACTVHYCVEDIKQYKNLSEWVPRWCFRFIEWALKEHQGRCSFKLDWFAQKGLQTIHPQVVGNLTHDGKLASDHDAISVDFIL